MIFTIDNDLELCSKYKITIEQLCFVKLYIIDRSKDLSENKALFMKRNHEFCLSYGLDQTKQGRTGSKERVEYNKLKTHLYERIVKPLMDEQILSKINLKLNNKDFDIIEINPKFVKDFEINVYGMPTELSYVYPQILKRDSKIFPMQNSSPEEFGEIYIKNINNDINLHNEIIELVKWAKDENKIMMAIDKFVKTKNWLALKELKEGGGDVGFDTNLV